MKPARALFLALSLPFAAACAEAPPPPAAAPVAQPTAEVQPPVAPPTPEVKPTPEVQPPPAAPPAAPTVTRQMLATEWDKLRKSGAFTPVDLPRVGEPRYLRGLGGRTSTPLPPGAVRTMSCQPGGPTEGFVTEKATGALWMLQTTGGVSAPRGVVISATRCYEHDYQLPAGKSVTGVITVSFPNHLGDH